MVAEHLTFLVKQTKNSTNVFFILRINRGLQNRKLKEFYSAINCSINHATNFHSRNNATVYVIRDNSADYGNHVIVFVLAVDHILVLSLHHFKKVKRIFQDQRSW